MALQLEQRSFTVDEYYRMAEAGILTEDDRVELIEGRIVTMSPTGSRHAACVDRLNHLFGRRVARDVVVRVQSPIRLDEFSEPEPDLALLQPRDDFYARQHPGPGDVLLVVADASEGHDRDVKVPLYARAGIPEVWLVNLPASLVEVHTRPVAGDYQDVRTARPDDRLAVPGLPDLTVAAADLLP